MAHTHTSESAHSAPAPHAAPSIDTAALDVYHALLHIGPARLGHGYGCPSETNGPCTCGTAELSTAMVALKAALDAAVPAP